MDQQTAKASAAAIVAGLKKAGINFVASLPDEKMLEVIRAVETDPDLKHVPLCREEEGIGICAGAYLAGKKTAIIMQNAGFLNSCNALTTTSLQFQIPDLDADLLCRGSGRSRLYHARRGDRAGASGDGFSHLRAAPERRDR